MNEQMRVEFEAWAIKAKCQHGVPYFVMKDDSGMYIDHGANIAWQAWQASRAALVVNLPISVCRTHVFELPHTNEVGMEHDEYYEIDDVKKSLEAAGVSYK